MKPFTVTIKDPLKRGLATNDNPRNQPFLTEAIGALPYNNILQAVTSFSVIDTSSLGTLAWPYPQLFVCSNFVIVCTDTSIYEYTGGTLVRKIGGLPASGIWMLDAEKDYLVLSNSEFTIVRDPKSKLYIVTTLPPDVYAFYAICNYNGQMVISPRTTPLELKPMPG